MKNVFICFKNKIKVVEIILGEVDMYHRFVRVKVSL